ncbi:MAG: SRPBCC domain-containing protein [Cytophagaceae bacterium]
MIQIETKVKVPVAKAWLTWTEAKHIMNWNFATTDWHCPAVNNPLEVGATFTMTMAAKDGSFSFDFGGVYTDIILHKKIAYTLGDDRKVEVTFIAEGDITKVIEVFEPESENPVEMQKAGWQMILDRYKSYTEEKLKTL